MEKLLSLHNLLLKLHIKTKTVCSQFHEKSAAWYEFAFDVFHELAEKRQDLWLDAPTMEETAYQEYYDNLLLIRWILESMVKEKNSIGMDNLLRGKLDELEWHIWDAKAFLSEDKEEYKEKSEESPMEKWLKPKK